MKVSCSPQDFHSCHAYSLLLANDKPLIRATCSRSTIFGRDQHVEIFSHAGRSYQVLELQGDFGALLGQAAVFEGVGELIALSNSHQEL